MKRFIVLGTCLTVACSAAIANTSALPSAHETPQIIKDTRVFRTYTLSFTDDGVCRKAKDHANPTKGDCPEEWRNVVIGGELIQRLGSVCVDDTFSLGSERGVAAGDDDRNVLMKVPSVTTRSVAYTCDHKGVPVGAS